MTKRLPATPMTARAVLPGLTLLTCSESTCLIGHFTSSTASPFVRVPIRVSPLIAGARTVIAESRDQTRTSFGAGVGRVGEGVFLQTVQPVVAPRLATRIIAIRRGDRWVSLHAEHRASLLICRMATGTR